MLINTVRNRNLRWGRGEINREIHELGFAVWLVGAGFDGLLR